MITGRFQTCTTHRAASSFGIAGMVPIQSKKGPINPIMVF
jgi:hypothetical protein